MATVIERVPLDRINARAQEIRLGHALAALFAGILFVVGWLAAKAVGGVVWCAAAVVVGWQTARARPDSGG